jgi:hypothetical protein
MTLARSAANRALLNRVEFADCSLLKVDLRPAHTRRAHQQ